MQPIKLCLEVQSDQIRGLERTAKLTNRHHDHETPGSYRGLERGIETTCRG